MTDDEVRAQMAADDTAQAAREARLSAPGALASAALYYARHGIAVFPLKPGGKAPATAHGLHDATTDLEQVTSWWKSIPDANIGIRTGLRFDVVDIDGPAGFASLAELRDAAVLPDVVGHVTTPRGAHLYVPAAGRGNKAGVYPGIDYRGVGGYVVGPPSRSEGGTWRWTRPLDLEVATVAA